MVKSRSKDAHIFIPQTDGNISDSLLKNWTQQAYDCYKVGSDCTRCTINKKMYSFVCQMPKVVAQLINNNIKPDVKLYEANPIL